jgi:hypothetical protein
MQERGQLRSDIDLQAVRTAGLVLSGFLTPETRKALRQVDG